MSDGRSPATSAGSFPVPLPSPLPSPLPYDGDRGDDDSSMEQLQRLVDSEVPQNLEQSTSAAVGQYSQSNPRTPQHSSTAGPALSRDDNRSNPRMTANPNRSFQPSIDTLQQATSNLLEQISAYGPPYPHPDGQGNSNSDVSVRSAEALENSLLAYLSPSSSASQSRSQWQSQPIQSGAQEEGLAAHAQPFVTHVNTSAERVQQLALIDLRSVTNNGDNGNADGAKVSRQSQFSADRISNTSGMSTLVLASFFEHIPPSADAGTLREVISRLRGALRQAATMESFLKAKVAGLELQVTGVSKALVDAQDTLMDLEDALQLQVADQVQSLFG